MPSEWKVEAPKNDDEYFERMSRALFQSGLNWKVIENKWPNFQNSFARFSIEKVSRFGEKEAMTLVKDSGIVRNERKIRSVIANAQEFLRVRKEFGSFNNYLQSFGGKHERLVYDLTERFRHLGVSTARMFLYMSGVKLMPTQEEKLWHS